MIVPAFTWVSTANAVIYCGALPVLADVDRRTNNLDPQDVRVLKPAHESCDGGAFVWFTSGCSCFTGGCAKAYSNHEDAACAAGGCEPQWCDGWWAWRYGLFLISSSQSISTGEGGMLTMRNDALFAKAEVLRNHGASISRSKDIEVRNLIYCLPLKNLVLIIVMTDIQAAIGLVQLSKLDTFMMSAHIGLLFMRSSLQTYHGLKHQWCQLVCVMLGKLM